MSMPPIPIERMNGNGMRIRLEESDRDGRAETITDRPAWVDVSASASSAGRTGRKLLAEPEGR